MRPSAQAPSPSAIRPTWDTATPALRSLRPPAEQILTRMTRTVGYRASQPLPARGITTTIPPEISQVFHRHRSAGLEPMVIARSPKACCRVYDEGYMTIALGFAFFG